MIGAEIGDLDHPGGGRARGAIGEERGGPGRAVQSRRRAGARPAGAGLSHERRGRGFGTGWHERLRTANPGASYIGIFR